MEANTKLAAVIQKSQTSPKSFRDPTPEEIDRRLDETRRDVDGVTMSWEETRHRYSNVPKCSLKIVWAYWIEVMTPLQPPQGEESKTDGDWCLAEGVKIEELPKEESVTSP